MKLTKEQMLMVNGALAEYRITSSENGLWSNDDEKDYEQIVMQLRAEYKKAVKGVKNVRAKASARSSN